MGRAILVLSVPRAGSSAVAGALHHLGVDMGGEHLQPGNQWNPGGYFEDLRWQRLNKQITGERYGHCQPKAISQRQEAQYRALAEACEAKPLWGMKDPRLCFTAQFIWPLLDDPRVVAVMRGPAASAWSLMEHSKGNYHGQYRMTLKEATRLRALWASAMERRLADFPGPVQRVHYEDLVKHPKRIVGEMALFAFDGLRGLTPDLGAAVAFVNPELRHA
jgi:hypothetical protein